MILKIGKAIMICWWVTLGILTLALLAMKIRADMQGTTVDFGMDWISFVQFMGVYFFGWGLTNWDEKPEEVEGF